MKINLLSSDVYNKIAAGEVVEKPFNVVKELVENSIDAGASEIKIEIAAGGLEMIKVTDNGCGIDKDQIPNAFASHATSKIKTADDLNKVLTLGFRGEALASIASVSKITLITKTEQDAIGTQVENNAGNIVSMIDVGCPTGTSFEVRDLFFNIPARKKFLKKEKLEEADIAEFVERLILSHPEISFSLKINGKNIYNFTSSNLENAIFTIYGKEVYSNLIKVDETLAFFDKDNEETLKLTGFVGKPKIAKGNKKDQTFFINGRFVKNQTVQAAISRAFDSYLMKGKYPFYVLNLEMPTNKVDVNVHPTKQDVRFENNGQIFDFIYKSISQAILKAVSINLDDALQSENEFQKIEPKREQTFASFQNISLKSDQESIFNLFKAVKEEESLNVASPSEVELKLNSFSNEAKTEAQNSPLQHQEFGGENDYRQNANLFDNYKIIGRVFDTYIILEQGDFVHFLDQHALHERILFDKFSKQLENAESMPKQQLLVPIIKTLNAEQSDVIMKNKQQFSKIGIEFEEFGKNTFRVGEIPQILQDLDFDKFLDDIFENALSASNLKSQDIIKDKLATMACKAAIKAGTTITENEIKQLLDEARDMGIVLQCPHGRPLIITYSKKDIEKWFKRIV